MSKYIFSSENRKDLFTVDIYVKSYPNGSFRVLRSTEEASLRKKKLPKDIKKESSTWLRRKSFGMSNRIEDETWDEIKSPKIGVPIQYKRNYSRLQLCRLKYLLKDWTLKEHDPKLELKFVPLAGSDLKVISDIQLKFFDSEVDGDILEAFLDRAMNEIIGPIDKEDKEALASKN